MDANGIITTAAGKGWPAFSSGDGGPATSAAIAYPEDVAVDSKGNLFIAENNTYCNLVRKVDASGVITRVAGNGVGWPPPIDGAPATQGGFSYIDAIEVDQAGNLYILSSYEGPWVWKVDTAGIVTTVAGTGRPGFSGDGGPAKAAALNTPNAIAVDARGDLLIADTWNYRVRKVSQVPAQLRGRMSASEIGFSEEAIAHILSSSGRHLRTVELDTGVVLYSFGYDQEGRLESITDRFGRRSVIERAAEGRPRAIVSGDGIRTDLGIDANNHLTRIGYADGTAYRFEYTAGGLATLKVQPSGNQFIHVYDENGRLQESLDGEGGSWRFSKNMLKTGEALSETLTAEGDRSTHVARESSTGAYESTYTDASGAQSKVSESADGLAVESALSCGMNVRNLLELDPVSKYKYVKESTAQTPSGLKRVTTFEQAYTDINAEGIAAVITRKISVNGRSSILTHDIGVARKVLSSAEGRTLTAYYDPETLLTERLQVPGLSDTLYTYDRRGRLTQAAVGSRATLFGYTDKGFLSSVTDAQGRTTSYAHDALGRVRQVSRPDQSQIRFDYDANGSMTVLVNPSGVAHKFAYNKVNRPSAYTTPLSGSYLYKYDRDRRLIETVLPSGRSIRNLYDKGRLARTETPEGDIYFNYLCGRKLGSMTQAGEGISYAYDGSLLTSESLSGSLNQGLSYVYDNDFKLVQATYAGQATGYGYDYDGLLTQAGAFAIARDAGNGLPYAVTDGRLSLTRGFNGCGEVASQALTVSGRPVSSWSLLRDSTGRITRRSEAVGGISAVYDYLYDANGRLLKVLKDNVPVEEYAYDENGTRIYEMNTLRGIASRSYEYSDEDHLLKAGEWAYQYDLDGFLTAKINSTNPTNKTSYFYSSRGELLTVILPDGKRIDYVCDPLGRRIAKKVNGLVIEKYLWQGLTRLLAVYDGNNSLLMRFEYADDRMPVAMRTGGATYYLSYDQVGSLRLVADDSGNVVKRISYDSFGNTIEDTNPSFAVPFSFAGGLHDRDTGLVRFGYRDYDPEVGRWTAKDPIGFAGGNTDLYGYVLNNSVSFIDASGLSWQAAFGVNLTFGGGMFLIPAFFGGGGTSVGITSNGQLFIQFQATAMMGAGVYGGVGGQAAVSHSACPIYAGITTQTTAHVEYNAGIIESAGYAVDIGGDSQSVAKGLRGGFGFGIMAASGVSTVTTIATPALW